MKKVKYTFTKNSAQLVIHTLNVFFFKHFRFLPILLAIQKIIFFLTFILIFYVKLFEICFETINK